MRSPFTRPWYFLPSASVNVMSAPRSRPSVTSTALPGDLRAALEVLVALLERQAEAFRAVLNVPAAGHLGRHDPQIDLPDADLGVTVGLPVAQLERVRDHARAGLQLVQHARPQIQVDLASAGTW